MSIEAAGAAFQRLVDALNQSRDEASLRAAVTGDVQIDRHTPGERAAAPIAESFAGKAEVARWFLRMPPVIRFALAGAPWPDGDGRWGIEYAYEAGTFRHGGIWLARLADDGRIQSLSHHPFALRADS